jgi:hypothetical protein
MSSTLRASQNIDYSHAHIKVEGGSAVVGSYNNIVNNLLHDSLSNLRGAERVHWDRYRCCMENTGVALVSRCARFLQQLEDAGTSISQPNQGAQIRVLFGMLGTGMSTTAHTVARECASVQELQLLSFFFHLDSTVQNRTIFARFIRDICARHEFIHQNVAARLKQQPSLGSAPLSHQFHELILEPARSHPPTTRIAIVVDALDEAFEDDTGRDLVRLLSEDFPKLPESFRMFITARSSVYYPINLLAQCTHVTVDRIDATSPQHVEDITLFCRKKFESIAAVRKLGKDWPTPQALSQFVAAAGGLWTTIIENCFHRGVFESESCLSAIDSDY